MARFWQQGEEGLYRDGLCKKKSGTTLMLDRAIWRWLQGEQQRCGASVIPVSAMGYFLLCKNTLHNNCDREEWEAVKETTL